MRERLTKQDWIKQGLWSLAAEGAGALKVGAMADRLGVSRGSFYWHFADFAEFRQYLMEEWRERAVDQIIRELDQNAGTPGAIMQLMTRAFFGKRLLEKAVRMWATDDQQVAAMVASVDSRRVAYLAQMLNAAGVDGDHAQSRALFIYWAYLGQPIVMDPSLGSIAEPGLESLSDLFEH